MLLVDIETAPNLAYVWGMWQQNVSLDALVEPGYTLCWAAKWLGEKKVFFSSIHNTSEKKMIKEVWGLVNEADAVIHFNGRKFDMPTLNKEFLLYGFGPPAPYKEIDLLPVCRKQFRFPSNKLDYVARALGVTEKVKHMGYTLWTKCMAGDDKAWKQMEKYNRGDVKTLEEVYDKLLAWIPSHPNHGLYVDSEKPVCVNCGSDHIQKRGTEKAQAHIYPRFKCINCGKWMRGRSNVTPKGKEILA